MTRLVKSFSNTPANFAVSCQTNHLEHNFSTKLIFPLTFYPMTHHRYTTQNTNHPTQVNSFTDEIRFRFPKVYYDYPKLKSEHFKISLWALK